MSLFRFPAIAAALIQQFLTRLIGDSLRESISLLESVPGMEKSKLLRLARSEMKLAEIMKNISLKDEEVLWKKRAWQHYFEALGVEARDNRYLGIYILYL